MIVIHEMKDPTHLEKQPNIVGVGGERLLARRKRGLGVDLLSRDTGNVGGARAVEWAGGEKVAVSGERRL
jgi:hypothetical protein